VDEVKKHKPFHTNSFVVILLSGRNVLVMHQALHQLL